MAVVSPRAESESARDIARVAARLFATYGYDATSIRMIVEGAGVARPTLYYHFGNKEGLRRALVTEPLAALEASLRAIVEGPGDALAKAVALLETQFAFTREDPDRVRFLFAIVFGPPGSDDPSTCSTGDCRGAALTDLMVAGVRGLVEGGWVEPGRAEACASAYRGMFIIRTLDCLYGGGELGPDLAGRIVDDLLRGFGRVGPGIIQEGSS